MAKSWVKYKIGIPLKSLYLCISSPCFTPRLKSHKGQLVTTGIFAHIRHPHYTSLLIVGFGLALFFFSLAALLIAVLAIPLMIWSIIDEEKLLLKQYGKDYKQYMEDVPYRLIPRIF